MRTLLLILLSVCFLLFGASKYVYSSNHYSASYSLPVLNVENAQESAVETTNHGHTIANKSGLDKDFEYLISLEESEEDTSLARKYTSPANYFIFYAFILSYLFSSFKYRLLFCEHLSYISSYKYLTQRVLRI